MSETSAQFTPDGDEQDVSELLTAASEVTVDAARFLADVTAELAEILDPRRALHRIAGLSVPVLADWCAVDTCDADGGLQRLTVVHREAERLALVRDLMERYPPRPDTSSVAQVLRSGTPLFVPVITHEMLVETAEDPEHLRLIEELGLHSFLCVPLRARGRTLGALSLATAESGRTYTRADLRLAQDLAARAALFVDNARLYEQAQHELAERRRAETALQESQDRLQLALQAAEVGAWDWDITSGTVRWSENMEAIHCVPPGSFDGSFEGFLQDVHPEDRDLVQQRLREALDTQADYSVVYRLASQPGRRGRFVLGRGRAVYDARGRPVRMAGVCLDVTERTEGERELARLAAVVESSDDAIIGRELDGTITSWNAAAERLYGYPAEDMIGRNVEMLVPPERRHELPATERALREGRRTRQLETMRLTREGRRVPVSLTVSPIMDAQGVVVSASVIVRDMSEQRRARTEVERLNRDLKRRVDELQTLLDVAPVGIAVAHDPQGRVITMNPAGAALRGIRSDINASLSGSDAERLPFRALCEGKPLAGEDLPMQRAMRDGISIKGMELEIARADGHTRTLYEYASPLFDETGRVRGGLGVFVDITERKQAEEALRESRERLLAAMLASETGTFRWDIRSNEIELDENLKRLLGLRPQDAAVRPLGEFIALVHPDDRLAVRDASECSARDGLDFDLHYRVVWPDGSVHWLADKGKLVRDADGTPLYMTGACVDVTERQEVEEALRTSEERFRTALRDSPIIVFNQDAELRYTWMHNPAALHVANDFLGRSDRELFGNGPEVRALEALKLRVIRQGTGERHEIRLKLGGRERWYDINLEPRRDLSGRIVGLTGAAFEISERMQMEAKLRRQAQMLREADRRKDEFLAMLAHELRNPLAPIRNAVQLFRILRGPLDPKLRWATDVIDRQVGHMTRLVDDLLDVARITRGRIELRRERVDLADIIVRAVETVMPHVNEQMQQLEVDLPPTPVWVNGDGPRLAQVVANLLHNASKYTEEQGCIGVSLALAGERAHITVTDTGVGIPLDMLAHVFDLFAQGERSLDRAQGGLGLGLTLVRSLVEMHGGEVAAHSAGPGKGSTFSVSLPLASQDEGPAAPPEPARPPRQVARRVLVVDDNEDVANSFTLLLEALGHEVSTAYDGAQALEATSRERPVIVFLDIGLPGMDGFEVARRLRAQHGESLTLVALTGYRPDDDGERARAAGFNHYMLKPCDPTAVEQLLDALND